MKHLFYLLLCGVVIISCKKEDSGQIGVELDRSKLQGEWLSINGNSATDLMFVSNNSVSLTVYDNIDGEYTTYDDEGVWNYYPENQVLRFTFFYHPYPDFSILELNENSIKLRNRTLNSVESYYKVDGTNDIIVGESTSFAKEPTGYQFSSNNTKVVSVAANGEFTGIKEGISFISSISDKDTTMTKIKVFERPSYYAKEVLGTIDEVLAAHGSPDVSGNYNLNKAILYNQSISDSKLSTIQYHYDEVSRKVTRILCVYHNKADWENDQDYIEKNNYSWGNGTSYMDKDQYNLSTIQFEVFKKSEFKQFSNQNSILSREFCSREERNGIELEPFDFYQYYISYINHEYYLLHNYY